MLKDGLNNTERILKSVGDIGGPVCNGAISTFLAVSADVLSDDACHTSKSAWSFPDCPRSSSTQTALANPQRCQDTNVHKRRPAFSNGQVMLLSVSKSYVFRTLFKQFFGTVLFGVFNGLIVLPVMLPVRSGGVFRGCTLLALLFSRNPYYATTIFGTDTRKTLPSSCALLLPDATNKRFE